MELMIILLLTVILIPVAEITTGAFRIILAVIALLFFPGYTLMAALFPRKGSMQNVERVILSFILSIAIVPLLLLIINYTTWGIQLGSVLGAVASFIFVASLVAVFRRRRLPESERFKPDIHITMPRWGVMSRLDRVLSIVLVVSVLGAIGALIYVVTVPREEEPFTDFYMLGSGGMVEDYPQELVLGDSAELTLGIKNHEDHNASYNIEIILNGETVQEIGPVILNDEEEWQQGIILVPTLAGEDQKAQFLLYEGESTEPYLSLHLWLDVKEGE